MGKLVLKLRLIVLAVIKDREMNSISTQECRNTTQDDEIIENS